MGLFSVNRATPRVSLYFYHLSSYFAVAVSGRVGFVWTLAASPIFQLAASESELSEWIRAGRAGRLPRGSACLFG